MTNQAVLEARASSLELAQMHTTIVCLSIDLYLGHGFLGALWRLTAVLVP